jgi:cytochrome P450
LIVAGFETSAGTLNWAWHLIAQNEHVYRKIVNEARAVLPVASATSRESVANLTYLEQVLNETMRLYPPGWIFSRRATENLTLADYDVPEGTDVYISPYILHRTEAFWPDAQRFDPGRFAADRLSAESQAAFIPFSLGPRRCIGEHFAMLEMKIHLALMLQRFRPHPTTDEVPVLHFAINLRSQGSIHLRLEKCNAT